MDFEHAEKLMCELADIVDHPLYDQSPRLQLSATLAVSSLQFGAAVRALCAEGLILGAATSLRSQFESLIRSVWALHQASELQVEKLTAELNLETQQASRKIPLASEMLGDLEKVPELANLLIALHEFKTSSWAALNSFVHSGLHAVHWTKHAPPPQLLRQVFLASNGLSLLAYQGLGMLTGRPGLQHELIAATATFSSCLPPRRPGA